MITTTIEIRGTTKGKKEVRYVVSGAEEISKIEGLEERSVDWRLPLWLLAMKIIHSIEGMGIRLLREIGAFV